MQRKKVSRTAIREAMRNGKERCIKCGHNCYLDQTIMSCNYILDADAYNLPRRPWPRPKPCSCIYFSQSPRKAGSLTDEEKLRFYTQRFSPVLDKQTATIYATATEAADATGIESKVIRQQCRRHTDINNPKTRFRRLTIEEREVLVPHADMSK